MVRGRLKANSIVVGNPARRLCDIREWIENKQDVTISMRASDENFRR